MAGLRADEIASIRGAVAGFLPDLVLLYASDGATQLWSGQGRLSNDRSLQSRRDANDFTSLVAPYGTPVAPGLLVRHAPLGVLDAGDAWYVVAKVSIDLATTVREQAMLLALPLGLVVTRAHPPATSDGQRRYDSYGAPLVAAGHTDAELVTTTTIRAAISTDMDLRQDTSGAGPVRTALMTLLTPLGSAVAEGDVVTVRGQDYRVANLQTLASNGEIYAWQLELKTLI